MIKYVKNEKGGYLSTYVIKCEDGSIRKNEFYNMIEHFFTCDNNIRYHSTGGIFMMMDGYEEITEEEYYEIKGKFLS